MLVIDTHAANCRMIFFLMLRDSFIFSLSRRILNLTIFQY